MRLYVEKNSVKKAAKLLDKILCNKYGYKCAGDRKLYSEYFRGQRLAMVVGT